MAFALDVLAQAVGWASIYALIAVGFSLIFSSSKIINLAQGEFVMLGGLMGFSLYSLHLPLPLIPFVSAVTIAVVGVALERIAIRPAKQASVTSLIIITVALSIILRSTAALVWGPHTFRIPAFFTPATSGISAFVVAPDYLLLMVVCLVTVGVISLFLRKTKLGRCIRACSMDPVGARIVGVSPEKMRMLSFFISAGVGGMVGVLIAPVFYASSDIGLGLGIKGFCAAVLGGMGSIPGAIAGALIIGLSEAIGVSLASSYKDVIAPLIMILVLYIRPQGILGGRG